MDEKSTARELKLTFCGGAGKVTGANFLLESGAGENSEQKSSSSAGTKLLVDCGLIQGGPEDEALNFVPFPYDPSEIDFLLVTHAHIDHIGRIGKLVRDGFRGTIYSTDATRDLAEPMLADALKLMPREGGRGRGAHDSAPGRGEPLYDAANVELALSLWKTVTYHEQFVAGDFSVVAKDAGHVLGSALYEITHTPTGKKVAFSGDLGNSPSPILRDTEPAADVEYLLMESVYGDRNHEERAMRTEKLREVAKRVIARGGVLMIPVFSLEKTQVLLYELDNLVESGAIPSVPVFLDSPLGIKLTAIYGKYGSYFNEAVQKELRSGDEIFNFPKLQMTLNPNESDMIHHTKPPMIIISSSGMSEGGRITAHEKHYLPDARNAVLFIGYQVSGSLGRSIKEGTKRITIDGQKVPVRAEVISIDGYSSHKDSDGLLDFAAHAAEGGRLKKIFLAMGEPKSAFYLAQRIRDNLDVEAIVPEYGSTYTL